MIALALAAALAAADGARESRLDALEREIVRLQRERDLLATRESGLLGDVARMDAEIALRRARLEQVNVKLHDTEESLRASESALAGVEASRARRETVVAARLREMYKRRERGLEASLLAPIRAARDMDGLRYAAYLARRDAAQLTLWKRDARRLDEGRAALAGSRATLLVLQADAAREGASLEAGRAARGSLLAEIRDDRVRHEQALGELTAAAKDLSRLVETVGGDPQAAALDVRKFRGLLDWPSDGRISAGFGRAVHPRFKTEIPHPGLDLDAPAGTAIRAIFDGHVAYAATLHGYGLTAVVDHGHGVISVYAHAAALTVASGEEVSRGQEIGRVGESESLRGPYLYFELRESGKPVDPRTWLRER